MHQSFKTPLPPHLGDSGDNNFFLGVKLSQVAGPRGKIS